MTTTPGQMPALRGAIELLWRDRVFTEQPNPLDALALHVSTWPEAAAAAWAALRRRFTVEELQLIDADLAKLSATLLEEVCVGEMPEPLPIHPRTFEALSIITVSLR